jgi:hypothetical protein
MFTEGVAFCCCSIVLLLIPLVARRVSTTSGRLREWQIKIAKKMRFESTFE